MDTSMIIGILIGAVIVLGFLAMRRGSGGGGSTRNTPTVRRAGQTKRSVADKHAAKKASVERAERVSAASRKTVSKRAVRQSFNPKQVRSKGGKVKAGRAATPPPPSPTKQASKATKKSGSIKD